MEAGEATTWTRLHLVAAGTRAELAGAALCEQPFDAIAVLPGAGPEAPRLADGSPVTIEPRLAVRPGDGAQRLREALAELARAGRGGQVLVVLDTAGLKAAVALALGLGDGARAAGSVCAREDRTTWAAVDWPVQEAERARPRLAGLDLEGSPPRTSAGREAFPGGTGGAAEGRRGRG